MGRQPAARRSLARAFRIDRLEKVRYINYALLCGSSWRGSNASMSLKRYKQIFSANDARYVE